MEVAQRLVGTSAVIRELDLELTVAARSNAKVLITGESGVGKEVVARLIHQRSQRATGPVVTINCAGVPDTLLESELFGHVRGGFTDAYRDRQGWLELGHGGTVFMDEVGEMSLRMQALLLRFLENGEIQRVGSDRRQAIVDVRVICATNRNLMDRLATNEFREDLYYRLNVIHLRIPPLRERAEDIPLLVTHFVRVISMQQRVEPPQLAPEVLNALRGYRWPGNVRELRNVIERLIVRCQNGFVQESDLPSEVARREVIEVSSAVPTARPAVLLARMAQPGESFWSVVYQPFMSRDLTREDVRLVIKQGLALTLGNYKSLVQMFGMTQRDYKRFLNFLRQYDCHIPFQPYRSVSARVDAPAGARAGAKARERLIS